MKELAFSTVSDLSAALNNKALSPVELLKDVLNRLDKLEPTLNMFAAFDAEGAMADARASEERQMRGALRSPLDGIPTSIKDLIAQKGLPLRFGSNASSPEPAGVDAPAVERLRAAGAVLLGKSTTSEFGCKPVGDSPLTGITRNPWNIDKTPGGSSCGAAAMVAAGLVPYAIGTDGGGSVRIPASMCGLFGIKAQFGRVPIFPVSATPTLAHVGPISRTVQDAATVLSTIAGFDPRDPYSILEPVPDYLMSTRAERKLKIAWSPTLGFANPDPEIVEICAKAVDQLRDIGHEIDEVDHVMDDPEDLWNAEFYAGVGTRLRTIIEQDPDKLDPAVLEVLKIAISQEMQDYYTRVFQRYDFREKMRTFFDRYDLLISPTLPSAAVDVGKNSPEFLKNRSIVSWVFYTYAFNLTGQPAASMPVGFTQANLPVGMQVVGRSNDEDTIFALCGGYQHAFGLHKQRPELTEIQRSVP
ncbi:MAG: amidase family protein [Stappiaceae bacterium]